MMTYFYESNPVLQSVLLIFSLFAVILLATVSILLFRRRYQIEKQIGIGIVFLINVVLYVLMQLDNRISERNQSLCLEIPYAVLFVVTLMSLIFSIWLLLSETKNRKTINQTSIKESFDNLSTGVCFFNESGFPVLCNMAMHRFSFAVCGKDVQFITDLERCLDDEFIPSEGTRKDGSIFILSDGSAWHLEKRFVKHERGAVYTQYIASDITDLHKSRVELQRENEQLRNVQSDLKKLSANVVAVTREEEVLNAKMRVHDEMGRCLVAAQKYLSGDNIDSIPDSLATSWQRAVSMIKYNNDVQDEDMLSQIRKTCEFMKITFIQTGTLPEQESAAYILICAVRECVTNAARYAEATELYADFTGNDTCASVAITNNGKQPEQEIKEGGGLSTLRRRVERAGGVMTVQSFPEFKLTVTVPNVKVGVI